MYEVRIHGRGGQGAVTAASVLAMAAALEGKWVQSFPMFGVERRGAPVAAFVRIDEKPIDLRSQIYEPHLVMVMDPTLLEAVNVREGLREGGVLVINTKKEPREFATENVFVVDATALALKHKLGTLTNPIVNTAMLGAYARAAGNVKLESIVEALRAKLGEKAKPNVRAAREAYELTKSA